MNLEHRIQQSSFFINGKKKLRNCENLDWMFTQQLLRHNQIEKSHK